MVFNAGVDGRSDRGFRAGPERMWYAVGSPWPYCDRSRRTPVPDGAASKAAGPAGGVGVATG